MQLTIANISKTVTDAELQQVVAAIGKQAANELQAEWGSTPTIVGLTKPLPHNRKAPIDKDADAIIYLGDSVEDPTQGVQNALGYHADTTTNVPYGFVYLDVCKQAGENWTVTLSHETCELIGDPNADSAVKAPAPQGHGHGVVEYDLELCDPTQGDSYEIDGVAVSNFVGKAYFHLQGGTGNTNFLKLELAPLGVRPNGYFQYQDAHGRSHQVFGPQVTQAQKDAKAKLGDARRIRRHKTKHVVAPTATA